MKKLLFFLDFLGYQPSLTIKRQDRFQTVFTGLLSLIMIILSVLCIIYFGWDLVNKNDPIVLTTSRLYDDFGPLNMSNKGFNFIFAMESQDHNYFNDPSIFSVNATYLTKKNILVDNNITKFYESISATIDICSNFYKNEDYLEQNIKFPMNLFYCLKPDEVVINGFWGPIYTEK